jgi:hypothetical protein
MNMTIVSKLKGLLVGTRPDTCNVTCAARKAPEWSRAELRGAYLEGTNAGPYVGYGPTQ